MSALFDATRDVSCIQAAIMLGIPLKRQRGDVAWALCPLHGEKGHPSMWLSDSQGWYCYGCHKGGDAIRLYQEYLNCTPVEAARTLARDVGIDVGEDKDAGQLHVTVRHLKDALAVRRKALIEQTCKDWLEADRELEEITARLGESAFDDEHFCELLNYSARLEMRRDALEDMTDSELLELIKEEQGQ